jgi:GT2 family glycosyltransferase
VHAGPDHHRPRGPTPATTVVVVTWRGAAHLSDCLDALAAQSRPHRILVVDNASDDGTAGLLARHPSAPPVLRLERNTGYAGGIAAALSVVDTPLLAWLNDDAAPEPGWLAALEEAMGPGVSAVASVLTSPDGAVQSRGVRLTRDGHGAARLAPGEPFGFCGGAALLRTEALRAAGGVPAGFFCYYEDTDTAWRLRLAGGRVRQATGAIVRHRHGASTRPGSAPFHRWNERNRMLMLLRCAPAAVAAREVTRFLAVTAVLPLRRARGVTVPEAANFRTRLRLRVLAEIAARLPITLWQRWRIGRHARLGRGAVWNSWAGQ